jgi:hypothetical protein
VIARKTAASITFVLLASFVLTVALPLASYASSEGHKNTAAALAAATVLLMGQKNKAPAIATATGAIIAYGQYQDDRDRERRYDRYGGYRDRDNRYDRDSRYDRDDRYRSDDRSRYDRYDQRDRDEQRTRERLRTDYRYDSRDCDVRYKTRGSGGKITWKR